LGDCRSWLHLLQFTGKLLWRFFFFLISSKWIGASWCCHVSWGWIIHSIQLAHKLRVALWRWLSVLLLFWSLIRSWRLLLEILLLLRGCIILLLLGLCFVSINRKIVSLVSWFGLSIFSSKWGFFSNCWWNFFLFWYSRFNKTRSEGIILLLSWRWWLLNRCFSNRFSSWLNWLNWCSILWDWLLGITLYWLCVTLRWCCFWWW